jgi:NAD-dependent DNA ligase
LDDHEFLTKTYPYDEINSLIVSVMSDGIISSDEQKLLKLFFSEFVELDVSQTIDIDELNQIKNEITINGICSICPEIFIHDSLFCFTGASSRTTRQGLKNIIEALGGKFTNNVTQKTNYLVIGNEGNPCWAFSCYGRKVEAAVNLRKCGHKILIVHENDFWDSL